MEIKNKEFLKLSPQKRTEFLLKKILLKQRELYLYISGIINTIFIAIMFIMLLSFTIYPISLESSLRLLRIIPTILFLGYFGVLFSVIGYIVKRLKHKKFEEEIMEGFFEINAVKDKN